MTTTEFVTMPNRDAQKFLNDLSSGELVSLYNRLTRSDLKKFTDRATGVKRIWAARKEAAEKLASKQVLSKPGFQSNPIAVAREVSKRSGQPINEESFKKAEEILDEEVRVDAQFDEEYRRRKEADQQPQAEPVVAKKQPPPLAQPKHAPGTVIRLKTTLNPKKAGTKAFDRFELYEDGMTVGAALKAGLTREDIRWDSTHGHIVLEEVPSQ